MGKAPTRQRRVLTKSEAASAIGAELLALCEDVTADGTLDETETRRVVDWLAANEGVATEFPSVAYLLDVARRILADGKITSEERYEFHRAIEAVMPKAPRETAARARQATDAARIEAERRLQPIADADFMLTFASRFSDRTARVAEGDSLELRREPSNPYDPNAVAVFFEGKHIGYAPREDAARLAPLIDRGAYHRAWCKKVLGYNYAIPVVVAELFPPGVVIPDANPPRTSGPLSIPPDRGITRRAAAGTSAGAGAGAPGTSTSAGPGKPSRPRSARGGILWTLIALGILLASWALFH